MKQTKRILSLVLASVILLMYLVPVGSVQASADEYIAASYASNITVKTDRSPDQFRCRGIFSVRRYEFEGHGSENEHLR